MPNGTKFGDFTFDGSYADLRDHATWAYDQLSQPCTNRENIIDEIAGRNYSDDGGTSDRRSINLMEMYMSVFLRANFSREPSVSVSTDFQDKKMTADMLERAGRYTLKRCNAGGVWTAAVAEGLIGGMGMVKYGLKQSGTVQMLNNDIPVAEPTMRAVRLPDMLLDVAADNAYEMDFLGDFFRMTRQEIESSPLFANVSSDELASLAERQGSSNRVGNNSRRLSMMAQNRPTREFRQKVDCVDICVPSQGIILTCDALFELGHPLAERKYYGRNDPRNLGPYELLVYTPLPGEIVGLPPLSNLQDLHVAVNELWNKAVRDAVEAKQILYAQAAARQDADRTMKAPNGQVVFGNTPAEMMRELRFRGADPNTVMLVMQGEQLFNRRSGNMDALAGLGPQAETLGQDKLIQEAASRKIEDMQQQTETFVLFGIEKLMWYPFTDPLINIPLSYSVPGWDEFSAQDTLTREDIRGEYLDYNFGLVPHSINRLTPQQRVAAAVRMFELCQPLLEMAATQSGDLFQVREFIESIAELSGVSDIVEDWFIHTSPSRFGERKAVGQPPAKGAFSRREYVRRGAPRPAGQNDQQMNQLMSLAMSNTEAG